MTSELTNAAAAILGQSNTPMEWKPGLHINETCPKSSRAAGIKRALGLVAILTALALALNGCAIFSQGSSAKGRAAAKTAHNYIGVPYKLGGTTPKEGFDCSSLAQYVYARQGVKLPRSSAQQAKVGRRVRKSQLQPGDLVFFSTGKRGRVSHVGIYVGNDKFIHAPGRGKKTSIASLSSKYFRKTYHSARRVA